MIKQWIGYRTPDGKIEAVEAIHFPRSGIQEAELTREHNVVLSYVNFNTKADAITYTKEMFG